MNTLKNILSKEILLLLSVLLAFAYSHSLFHSGLLPTHDGEYHVIRFFEFDKAFRDGNLYPRWAADLNNGFGIPLFNYVYPLPNYVASLFHLIGFSFIDSFKANLLFATVVGSIFSYLWSKQFWGKLGGLATSVFYTFSPYHSLDLFIRGSVGEAWALALFPAFLWVVTKTIKDNNNKYVIPSGIILAFIIFSHNILAFMFSFLAISYSCFLSLYSKRSFKPLFVILALGIGLSSIFWLPAIFERQYVRGLEIYDYSKNFPDFYQLIIPSWGSGFSSGALQNQLSFQIGIANLFAIFCSVFLTLKKFKYKSILLFFLAWFIVINLLMLKISLPIWRVFPFMNYFQFPWRFLSLDILFAAFIAGSLVNLPKGKYFTYFAIILSILLGIGYTNVAYYLERNDNYYTTRSNFIDGTNSPGNSFNTIWMRNLERRRDRLVFIKGEGEIFQKENKSAFATYKVKARGDGVLLANFAYFPEWKVYVDDKLKKINTTSDGLFSFSVVSGVHDVKIKFEDTLPRKIAELITISSICLIAYFSFARIRQRLREGKT